MIDVRAILTATIEQFGSETKLAQAAGVSQQTVNEAKQKGRIGPRLAIGLERATNGAVPRHILRPDLWEAPQ